MTEAAAPATKTRSIPGGIRDFVAAHPVATATGLYGVVAIAMAIAAYLAIFTIFVAYDDEGTLLVEVKAFADGGTLYGDIYSRYGPFYYELFGGLFALTGHAVTTDASRSITIVVWVAASLLFGIASQRLTGLLTLGLTGMIVAFAALGGLTAEPMHPHGLSVLLLAAFALLVVSGPGRRMTLVAGACGTLLAALVLTKINLGGFAIAAVALAAVLTVEPLHRRLWVRWPVVAAFLAMPVVLLARDMSESWVRNLVVLEILAATAILVVAWPVRPKRGEDDAALRRWLRAAAVGFALAFAAIVGAILLTGPTPADVYEGIVGEAVRTRDALVTPLGLASAAVDWGIAAVAAAALTTLLRSREVEKPTIWPGLLRVAAGLTIWFTVARVAPFAINPAAGNPFALPLVLAWVAAIPPSRVREPAYRRFLRVLLPALAVAETLQVYPVAGTQRTIAAAIFVPVGALCLGDALACLRAWSAAGGARRLERLGAVVGVVTVALPVTFALRPIALSTASNAVLYGDRPALPFAAASSLHLAAPDVKTYTGVVNLLHRYRCTTFIGYPSVNSLYLWSSIDAPKPTTPGTWTNSLDSKWQQRVVDDMRASPRPCAIRSETRADVWLRGAAPPDRPLVRYIFDDFKPVARAGDFQFLLPKVRLRHGVRADSVLGPSGAAEPHRGLAGDRDPPRAR